MIAVSTVTTFDAAAGSAAAATAAATASSTSASPLVRTCLWVLCMALGAPAMADEGMWTFDQFPVAQMKSAYGWAPDAAWLKHVQLASVRLAQGCSASLVSAGGLVMTNHHCARECLSQLADPAHDYLAKGFYAKTTDEEKRCPDLEANQLVEISEVTQAIAAATAGKSDQAFYEAERAAKARIESGCGTSPAVRCQVVTLYHGAVYELYRYKRYQDIRVVFAPEERVAFFGGDPDNFTFPRFDLDTAFVRIYDNGKPLRSNDYLKFATTAVKQGDIAVVSGNPGSTERDDTLAQLQYQRDVAQPFAITALSELRGVLNEFATIGSDESQSSNPLRFEIENSLKVLKGRQLALVHGSIIADKTASEEALRRSGAADASLQGSQDPWGAIERAMQHQRTLHPRRVLLEAYPQRLSRTLTVAIALNRYAAESAKSNGERLEEYTDANFAALRQDIVAPEPFHAKLEKTVIAWWLEKLREDLGTQDPAFKMLMGKRSPPEIAAELVDGSRLADAAFRAQLLSGGSAAIDAYHEPLLDFVRLLDGPARSVRADYENSVKAVVTKNSAAIAAIRFAGEGKVHYPDATFTPRLSYGKVDGFMDNGVSIVSTTTFAGAYDHATGREPFQLPASWLDAQKEVNGAAILNFVTTNDVVGGNSGSPVVGRDGRVTGLVFDGNLQSLGGDYGYDGGTNRTIAVDVTGIVESFRRIYHADRLADELRK